MTNRPLFRMCLDVLDGLELSDHDKEQVVFMLSTYDSLLSQYVFTYGKPIRTVLEKQFIQRDEELLENLYLSLPEDVRPWFDRILISIKVGDKHLLPESLHPWYEHLADRLLPKPEKPPEKTLHQLL